MALLCTAMAWGSEIVVNDFAALKTALSAEGTADVVKLGANITYGSELLNIQRSLTLDGNGYTITGNVVSNLSVSSNKTFNKNAILAVNKGGSTSANLDVKIQNLKLTHSGKNQREIPFVIFDGVKKFTLDGVETYGPDNDFQALLITGTDATALQLVINNSVIRTANYPMYILKPINATLTNSLISGYCGMYFKNQWSSGSTGYGDTPGTRGSVVNADACVFDCQNSFSGASNNFAIFPLEDDGITLNLHNCSLNAETLGNTYQRFLNLQYLSRTSGFQPVNVKITGDNTHLYNVTANKVVFNGFTVGQIEPAISEGTCARVDVAINFTVEAGTFTFDPREVHWYTYSDNKTAVKPGTDYSDQSAGSGAITIDLEKYQVNEVKQGDKTLWRVTKKAEEKSPGVKYDLNDDVPTDVDGYGNNPNTSFELSNGSTMELNQNTTEAGYVQVKDNGSSVGTTVKVGKTVAETKVNQTLVINNGLDVQGKSTVEVQSGSTLQIGEGGITTQSSGNIVIEADEQGAGSLLLDPTITVNQNPNLTVKMLAKQIGREGTDFFWHRFAMPVLHIENWDKEGTLVAADPEYTVQYPTYVYAWDYNENDWKNIHPSQMVALQGYTLTLASDYIHVDGAGKVVSEGSDGGNLNVRQDVYYTFKGNLVGNTDQKLTFASEGFNFFGNSYTGYMHALTVINGIESDHVDNTIYMWNGEAQNYVGVSKYKLEKGRGLEAWQTEIAPMQTFILRLRGADDADESVSYASAIWGNPRYGNVAPAPARLSSADQEDAYLEIKVTAANGKYDVVDFTEMASKSDAFESAYDAEKYMNRNSLNLYADVEGINLSSVVTDDLIGKTLSMQTVNEVNYTMTFANVEGNEYALLDKATNEVIAITNDAVYTFSAQPNSTVENRFEIVAIAKAPTAVENTESSVKARGIYTMLGQYMGEDITVLPAGVYVVNGVKIVK